MAEIDHYGKAREALNYDPIVANTHAALFIGQQIAKLTEMFCLSQGGTVNIVDWQGAVVDRRSL